MKCLRVITGVLVAVFFLTLLMGMLGFRVNNTVSIPKGVYRLVDAPVVKGEYLLIRCPEDPVIEEGFKRGYIAPGLYGKRNLMKKLAAEQGDHVTIKKSGVFVNGNRIKNSRSLGHDSQGRNLKCKKISSTLQPDEIIIMGESKKSFDSRYFGALKRKQVVGVVRPVLTW